MSDPSKKKSFDCLLAAATLFVWLIVQGINEDAVTELPGYGRDGGKDKWRSIGSISVLQNRLLFTLATFTVS